MTQTLTYWIGEEVDFSTQSVVIALMDRLGDLGVDVSLKRDDEPFKASTQAILSPADLEGGGAVHCDIVIVSQEQPTDLPMQAYWLKPDDFQTHNERLRKFIQRIESRSGVTGLWAHYQSIRNTTDTWAENDAQMGSTTDAMAQEEKDRIETNFARQAGEQFVNLVKSPDWMNPAGQAWVAADYAQSCGLHAQKISKQELGRFFGHTKPDKQTGLIWGRLCWGVKGSKDYIEYEGETDGVDAHGHGVLTIGEKESSGHQVYRGQFVHGVRTGFGIAQEGKLCWRGAWQDDQPHGYGVSVSGQSEALQENFPGRIQLQKENNKLLGFIDMPFKPEKGRF